jgi:hypothetical protein
VQDTRSPLGGALSRSTNGPLYGVPIRFRRNLSRLLTPSFLLLQDICSPLIGALSKSENGVPIESFGAAHCLKALVDSEDVWRRASDGMVDDACRETAEVLRVDGAAVFLQLACSLARWAEYCLLVLGVLRQRGLYSRVQFVMDRLSLQLCKKWPLAFVRGPSCLCRMSAVAGRGKPCYL